MTPLLDAAAANTDMTVLILDNQTVAMTGTQDPIVPSERLDEIVRGLGVDPAHFQVLDPLPRRVAGNAEVIRREIEHKGLSVVVARRACKQIAARVGAAPTAAADEAPPAGAEAPSTGAEAPAEAEAALAGAAP
jgi:indolepyruvate ferredoxin oxidoreductase alpha subunit